MVYKFLALIASTALLLTSCSNDKTEEPVLETEVKSPSVQIPVSDSLGMDKSAASINPVPMEATLPKEKISASPALNPAHGEPGHRCDLAVGAPLPAANNTINTAPSVKPAEMKPVETKPALNPAHGQPGHRCDLAVGAPLDTPMPSISK